MSWLGGILKDSEKRAILSWLGGGAVVVAGGIWTVVTFVVELKDTPDKKGGTTITVGQGIASGGDTHINGPVNIGPSPEQIAQIQKPLTEQLDKNDAQIAIAALTNMLLEKRPVTAGPGAQQAVDKALEKESQENVLTLPQPIGALDRALKKLVGGNVAFNNPERMKLGKSQVLTAILSVAISRDD
jgi:hypothetical protein